MPKVETGQDKSEAIPDCFAIMPISDPDGYDKGHFKHVYNDIIGPACVAAGYKSCRADEVTETNLIHLDILQKLVEAPMAVCDLSSRNPNVLFELGLRQAFDKPVVLIQEEGTPRIFDISPLRVLSYSRDMKYHEVLMVQNELAESIKSTAASENDDGNVNSIVKLMSLSKPASLPEITDSRDDFEFEVLHAELRQLRGVVESTMFDGRHMGQTGSPFSIEYQRVSSSLDKLLANKRLGFDERMRRYKRLVEEADELLRYSDSEQEHRYCKRLQERVYRAEQEIIGF